MSHEGFSAGDVRATRRGEHGERVMYYEREGIGRIEMMGRIIPVISPEQLTGRLLMIGCQPEMIETIVANLFGVAVATEATIAILEVVESLV